jgi:hypothetical protein
MNMAGDRTTEHAEFSFNVAYNSIEKRKDRNSMEVQYAMYMALGLRSLSQAVREIYDKLEQIDRKLSTRT